MLPPYRLFVLYFAGLLLCLPFRKHPLPLRRRTTAGIRNASWALFVLKTAGNRKTEVSNETSVFLVEISGIEPLTS